MGLKNYNFLLPWSICGHTVADMLERYQKHDVAAAMTAAGDGFFKSMSEAAIQNTTKTRVNLVAFTTMKEDWPNHAKMEEDKKKQKTQTGSSSSSSGSAGFLKDKADGKKVKSMKKQNKMSSTVARLKDRMKAKRAS